METHTYLGSLKSGELIEEISDMEKLFSMEKIEDLKRVNRA